MKRISPYLSAWVRDHSVHTPAHLIQERRSATRVLLACGSEADGGRVVPAAEAVGGPQQCFPCRRCFALPLPRISARFGAQP